MGELQELGSSTRRYSLVQDIPSGYYFIDFDKNDK